MRKLAGYIREHVRNQEVVLASLFVALAIFLTPLQHYISLARFQHYSFAVAAIALGYLLQATVSFRRISLFAKLTLLGSSLFIAAVAYFFYCNPWLDNSDLATNTQMENEHYFAFFLLLGGIPLTFVWLRWNIETYTAKAGDAKGKTTKVDD